MSQDKTSASAFRIDREEGGLTWLTFDLPGEKVNKLSTPVMSELDGILDSLSKDSAVKVLLLRSAKAGIYIAGADIREIEEIVRPDEAEEKARGGQEIFNKLEKLPFPTVALIDGACLGGGLELALSCSYRIATDHEKTILGLPEVNLGILPGFGGTQRLPRLVGLQQSLGMILGGKMLAGEKALKAKLVDLCVPSAFLESRAREFAKGLLDGKGASAVRGARKLRGLRNLLLEKTPVGRAIVFQQALKGVYAATKGKYPAPLVAHEVIRKTFGGSLTKGLLVERQGFGRLAPTAVSKNLVRIFFTQEEIKKDAGASTKKEILPVKQAAVLGSGVMGGGIAWLFSKGDLPVRMRDLNWGALAKGFDAARSNYQHAIDSRRMDARSVGLKMHRISGTTGFDGIELCDFVVEAVVENLEVKKKVFAEIEGVVAKDAVIASNTSSLAISDMAVALKRPERFVGMHFFNPVHRMPLVEVIAGKKTDDESVARTVALAKKLGKTPIVVKDVPGFLVNRILMPYLNEAGLVLQDGVRVETLDRLLTEFGMPMGPFTLLDEIGIDVGYKVAHILEGAYGDRMKTAEVLRMAHEEFKWTGKKGGKGFYVHSSGSRILNAEVDRLLGTYLERFGMQLKPWTEQEAIDRCLLAMVNEASRCLEEKVVKSPAYLDMAMILGTGFPPFRGGILRWADQEGTRKICDRLDFLATRFGSRFAPTALVKELARNDRPFYSLEPVKAS